MNRIEKAILLCALIGQVAVISLGVYGLSSEPPRPSNVPPLVSALTMLLSLAAAVLILRDLYKREFPSANSKLTWLLIMAFTGGIGVIIYVFMYARRFAVKRERELLIRYGYPFEELEQQLDRAAGESGVATLLIHPEDAETITADFVYSGKKLTDGRLLEELDALITKIENQVKFQGV